MRELDFWGLFFGSKGGKSFGEIFHLCENAGGVDSVYQKFWGRWLLCLIWSFRTNRHGLRETCGSNPSLISILPAWFLIGTNLKCQKTKPSTIYIHWKICCIYPKLPFLIFPADFLVPNKKNMVSASQFVGILTAFPGKNPSSWVFASPCAVCRSRIKPMRCPCDTGPQRTNRPIPEIFRQLRQMFLDQMVEKGVGGQQKIHSLLEKFKYLGWWMLLNLVGNKGWLVIIAHMQSAWCLQHFP